MAKLTHLLSDHHPAAAQVAASSLRCWPSSRPSPPPLLFAFERRRPARLRHAGLRERHDHPQPRRPSPTGRRLCRPARTPADPVRHGDAQLGRQHGAHVLGRDHRRVAGRHPAGDGAGHGWPGIERFDSRPTGPTVRSARAAPGLGQSTHWFDPAATGTPHPPHLSQPGRPTICPVRSRPSWVRSARNSPTWSSAHRSPCRTGSG